MWRRECHTIILIFGCVCGIIALVMDMLIESVIQKEAQRNLQMIQQYEDLIAQLPKGSLICRKREYYYLKYRQDGKLCDEYIGKDPQTVARIREQLQMRKHYMDMLSALKQEQKKIQKVLEGLA